MVTTLWHFWWHESLVKGGMIRGMRIERLVPLELVAGICWEIGLAEYLDALAGPSQQQVSVGTATPAMILIGLGVQYTPAVSGRAVLRDQTGGAATESGHHGRATAFAMKRYCEGTVLATTAAVKRL